MELDDVKSCHLVFAWCFELHFTFRSPCGMCIGDRALSGCKIKRLAVWRVPEKIDMSHLRGPVKI